MMDAWLHSAFVQGAIAGLLTAVAVDFQAFRAWQSFDDLRRYNWSLAFFRWLQGAVIGAVTGGGLSFSF